MTQPATHETADDRRRLALLQAAEARLAQAASFTWAVPTLALAGQAFLLNIALAKGTSNSAQALAATAGLILLVASLHFMAKHTFNYDWWEAVIERERAALGWDSTQRNRILQDVKSFDPATLLRQREWFKPEPGLYEERIAAEGKELTRRRRLWSHVRRPLLSGRRQFAVRLKATAVWTTALTLLFVIDLWLLGDALCSLAT
jgi:hypothetical protein